MDYETFGEHQWADTGIVEFLAALPGAMLARSDNRFLTPAEVIATQKSIVYKLSRRSLKMLEQQNPWAAAAFHQYMASVLAKKLSQSHKFLSSLID